MSKKQTSEQQNNSNIDETLLEPESLSIAQAENLKFLEDFTSESYRIVGIPILKVLVYDFIQILNNMYLQSILGDNKQQGKAS